ncbi:hypothetical protein [Pontibacter harenae]|uniref:hypothetical protein n=1 Tax=Pontibacter harenae TaxID=2894083 RepID=UPI001E5AD588|nr:hypothetical protein [Pontibacter harenae]MCC9168384.1 hypothetical protein [Pontibacter harenae]
MTKFKLIQLLFASFLVLTFASCSNDDDEAEDISPNTSLLTAGEWTGSAVYINNADSTDFFEEQTNIIWNNYSTVFERDGTYTESYGGDEINGNWEFTNNERSIIFDKGTDNEYTVVVSKLDEDELFYLQSGIEFRFER